MAAFQQDLQSFKRLDAQVLGVSKDSLQSHRQFAESLNLEFPLVTDLGGNIQSSYGPGRITFVIDKSGVVRHVMEGMPNNRKLLDVLETLK